MRERKEDIPLLVEHFLKKFSFAERKVSPQVMRLFVEYPWKGNVRELGNVIERIALLTDKDEITVEDVPHEILMFSEDAKHVSVLTKEGIYLDHLIEDIEKKYLLNALEITDGNKTEAARLLNLSFRSFRHRLSKYGIK
ncbi:MAG: hypothetical protein FP832_03530 [Nitrospirae bacterium]|nr:hypothetical protein [Nitrospirota bacterium]